MKRLIKKYLSGGWLKRLGQEGIPTLRNLEDYVSFEEPEYGPYNLPDIEVTNVGKFDLYADRNLRNKVDVVRNSYGYPISVRSFDSKTGQELYWDETTGELPTVQSVLMPSTSNHNLERAKAMFEGRLNTYVEPYGKEVTRIIKRNKLLPKWFPNNNFLYKELVTGYRNLRDGYNDQNYYY